MAINVQYQPMAAAGAVASASGKRSYQQYLDQIALNNSQLQEQQRQYNTSQGESARQFDLGLSERQRQFDLGQQQQAEMFNADYFQKQNLAQFNAQANVLQNTIGQLSQNERLSQQIAANERLANFNRLAGLERQANQANIQYGMNYQDAYLRDALAQEQFGRQRQLQEVQRQQQLQNIAYEAQLKGVDPNLLIQQSEARNRGFTESAAQNAQIKKINEQFAQMQAAYEDGKIGQSEFQIAQQVQRQELAKIIPEQPPQDWNKVAEQNLNQFKAQSIETVDGTWIQQGNRQWDFVQKPKQSNPDPRTSTGQYHLTIDGQKEMGRNAMEMLKIVADGRAKANEPPLTWWEAQEYLGNFYRTQLGVNQAADYAKSEGLPADIAFQTLNDSLIAQGANRTLTQQEQPGQYVMAPGQQQQPVLAPEPVQPPPQMQQPAAQQQGQQLPGIPQASTARQPLSQEQFIQNYTIDPVGTVSNQILAGVFNPQPLVLDELPNPISGDTRNRAIVGLRNDMISNLDLQQNPQSAEQAAKVIAASDIFLRFVNQYSSAGELPQLDTAEARELNQALIVLQPYLKDLIK